MALTFTTGMTLADPNGADNVTNWAAVRFSGSGGAPSAALDTVTFRQGSGSIAARMSGANWDAGLAYDYYTAHSNAVLNLTTAGNEVLAVWVLCTSPTAILALSAGGIWIRVSSSADTGVTVPTAYRTWYISGANVYPGGWVLLMIDTRKTASVADVGSPNLASVRRIHVGLKIVASPPTLRSDNLYVNAIWYGRPNYTVVGDGSTTATWAAFLADSVSNNNGLITDLGGVLQVSCGLQFGTTAQAASTTFNDATGAQILFKRQTYYQGGAVDALNYADYYNIQAFGKTAGPVLTHVTMGSVVGAGDGRRGVLGGAFRNPDPTNVAVKADFQTGAGNLGTAKFYGVDFVGIKGGMLFENNAAGTLASIIGGTIVNCAEVDLGVTYFAEMLATSVINASTQGLTVGSTGEMAKATYCNFINCNYGVKMTAASASYGCSGNQFAGNTYDIENSSGGAITITPTNQSNVNSHHETGGGSTSISNNVMVTVSGLVSGSRVRISKVSDGTVLYNDAESGGTCQLSTNYFGAVTIEARKASGSPYYQPWTYVGTVVAGVGLSVTALQVRDDT